MPVHIYICNFDKWVAELNKRTAPYGLPIWITEVCAMAHGPCSTCLTLWPHFDPRRRAFLILQL